MKLSVNILCWNNWDVLQHSLNMLVEELKDIDSEIVIVDNGSTDGSYVFIPMWLNEHKGIKTKFIHNYENLGISKGKNQGIDASEGEYIFMYDGDVLPVANSIRLMMKFLDENPDKHAIGAYPNKFCTSMNKGHVKDHESYCNVLYEPVVHSCTCLFYGIYRRKIFQDGLRLCEEGEFGKAGYGWEDHDFFLRMKERGITQYVANINHERGRYFHKINSSIRNMGDDKSKETMKARSKQFKEIWNGSR